jgi:signal transduction histidine kinase/ligand-binding sensor domain-containing protein
LFRRRIHPFGAWPLVLFLLFPRQAWGLDLGLQPFLVRTWARPAAVFGAAQAPDGMLWFASASGLSRFDGERFVEAELEPGGKPPSWVRRVFVARDGAIWAATGSATLEFAERAGSQVAALHSGTVAELIRLRPGTPPTSRDHLRRFGTADGLPSPWVWALAQDLDGALWIGTESGLARLDGGRVQTFRAADGLPADFVTALFVDGDGALYVGTTAGVVVRRGDRFVPTPIREPVLAVARDRAGRLWAAGSYQVLRADPTGALQAFPLVKHESVGVDGDDNVWTGRRVFAAGTPAPLTTGDEDGYWATGILADREGSVWITVREGFIVQLQSAPVRTFGPDEGAPGRVAFSVLAARDGSIYASGEAGLARYAGGRWRVWRNGPEVGWGPKDIAEGWPGTSNAGLWLASSRLVRGGPDGFSSVVIPEKGQDFRSVIPGRDGDLWVSRDSEGLIRYRRSDTAHPLEEWKPGDGLCRGRLIHGFEASEGSIWFVSSYDVPGTQVTRIRNGRPRCYGARDGLPPARIGAIAEDHEGTIWLGTGWGAGLVRFRGERFATIPASLGLPAASVTGILDDRRGFLWLCTVAGVWRVPKADLERCADGPCAGVHATVFGKDEGMRNAECVGDFSPNLTLDQQGGVWAATLGGFTRFAPPEHVQPPAPIVESIAVDGIPIAEADAVELGPRQSDLAVYYTAATFLGEGRPRLRHRLRGFEADWVLATSPALAHYRNLPPGRYTLELQTGGAPAAVRRLSVMVAPPFWRSRTFLALVLAATLLGGMAVHRSRVARMRLQHRAVTEERARIARDLHDGLAQKLTAIALASQKPEPLPEGMARVRQIVGEAHAELRRAIWDMREGGTGERRLERLIEQVASEIILPAGTAMSLMTGESLLSVSGLVLHEVPLIVGEALTNVGRHARASNVEVGVVSDDDGLQVWVRDDGRGMPSAGATGAGLIGMHERARRLRGLLTVRSKPGEGTEIALFVPRDFAMGSRP